jgi:phosphoglucosamine mutase
MFIKMGRYFGTDGFRGEANVGLTADHAYTVGRFLGWYYGELKRQKGDTSAPRVVIGKDTRRSSYMFEYSLVGGLVASGADAYLLHVTTTPSVAYVTRVDEFDCGVMITASHNPFYDNGIKLLNGNGEKMDEKTIGLVEDYIDGNLTAFGKKWDTIPFATKDSIGCTVDYVSGRNRYVGYLISLGLYSFKGMKVGLDCANGASWNIAKSVFDALGATTYVINDEPNGTNINNNAGSTHIEGLQKFVVEKGLDVGFAYDGDADRCLCVDEKGNVVNGDHILYVYGKYMKDKGELVNNTVVTTVMSNFGLYKAFDEAGIDYAKTAVGDKYVYEYMTENNCVIGGEQSGHIIFSKYATTGDGIMTSIKMMEVMLARKKKMSELCSPLTIYPQVLENIRVTDKTAAQNDPDVVAKVDAVAKDLGDSGRILVRESGTEPVVRVMVEAEDKEICRNYVESVIRVIKDKGYAAK